MCVFVYLELLFTREDAPVPPAPLLLLPCLLLLQCLARTLHGEILPAHVILEVAHSQPRRETTKLNSQVNFALSSLYVSTAYIYYFNGGYPAPQASLVIRPRVDTRHVVINNPLCMCAQYFI